MSLNAKLALTHAIGAVILLATLAGGYRFAVRPALEARSLTAPLRARLAGYQADLRSLPAPGNAQDVMPAPESDPTTTPTPPTGLRPLTPTAFLSVFETRAREVGMRIESSKELDLPAGSEPGSGILVEVTGTGSFAEIAEFCGTVDGPLPGLEIRRLKINRAAGDEVRWIMVCRNYDGLAG